MSSPPSGTGPTITLAICTRGPSDPAPAIESALASGHARFEVLLIDQNDASEIRRLPRAILDDSRFTHAVAPSTGLGRARNAALARAGTDFVAFTDDDCTVPSDWLARVEGALVRHRDAAVVFTNVVAGPHDARAGFVPAYERSDDAVIRTLWAKRRARGMGASMGVRRSLILDAGGFDDELGPGARFPACEDGDMAVRSLLAGHAVVEIGSAAAIHHGFRTWAEGRDLARRNWMGVGAAYAKPLKCGHLSILVVLGYEVLLIARTTVDRLVRTGRPQGWRNVFYLVQGFSRGLRTPVDRRRLTFCP